MTPVQLPEVPARSGTVTEKIKPGLYKMSDAYTADQLRAYATEAIRQAANAIFAEGWYLACDWASRDDLKFDIDSPAFEADRAARLGNLLTQPEQNSGR